MWQINRITKETLLNISKYSNKVIKLAKYFQEANQPFVMQELMNMSDQTDQVELLDAFDKDIKKTVNELYEIQKLLITVDEEGNIKELKGDTKNLKDIFGDNYNMEAQKVNFPAAILDLNKPKEKKELKEELMQNILELSPLQYKELLKIKDILKDVDKEELSTNGEKINYLVNKSNIDFVKESVEKINQYVKAFVEIRKNLNFEEKELIDKKITSSRTMIDGVLNDSTFISLKDGIEQISPIHLKDNENANEIIDKIKKELEESKYINSIEIDKDTHLEKFLFLMKKVKGLHLNLTQEFEFKTRKLGNYRANGIYIHDNELMMEQKGYHNTEYNIVALDVNSPSSLVYELTNLVGLSNEEFIKSPLRRAISLHFKSKVNNSVLQENGATPAYLHYLRDNKKVMARLGEIGYILNKYDYKGHENKEDLNSFFDKVRLLENMEHKGEKEIPIVHKIDFYRENSAQYFDIDNLQQEELKIVKEYFKSYYNTIKDEFLPLENNSMLKTLDRLKEEQKLREIQEAILEEEEEENKPKMKKRRYNQEEFPISKVTNDNIKTILEYNDKEKVFTDKELCVFLSENIYHMSRRKFSLTMGEAANKIKIFDQVFEHAKETENENLQMEVINAITLKKKRNDSQELERFIGKEIGEFNQLSSFIPDASYSNKGRFERIFRENVQKMVNQLDQDVKPITQGHNHFIGIDKEEEEKNIENNLELLNKFKKDSIFLNHTILEIANKFSEYGGYVKDYKALETLKTKTKSALEENEEKIKESIKTYAEEIDKKIEEIAVNKINKIIEQKIQSDNSFGLNFRSNSVVMNSFTDEFLLKNSQKLLNEDLNNNSDEEKVRIMKSLDFNDFNKEIMKEVFSNIKSEDLRSSELYNISNRNYIQGVMNGNSAVNTIKMDEDLKKIDINLDLVSNIYRIFKDDYLASKYNNTELSFNERYEKSKNQAIENTVSTLTYKANNAKIKLERNPDSVQYLRDLNKKVIKFLDKKGLLENYIENYKSLSLSSDGYGYNGTRIRNDSLSKLSGLLHMQGIDITAKNALEELRKSVNKEPVKNGIKLN